MPQAKITKQFDCLSRVQAIRIVLLRLSHFGKQVLLLFLCLPLLAALSLQPSYQIQGISGDVLKNVEARLKELAEQQMLSQLSQTELNEQIIKALEPFGYFRSVVRVRSAPGATPLLIQVNPGPQLRITNLHIEMTGEGKHHPELQAALGNLKLKRGQPLLMSVYNESKDALLTAAEHLGYLHGTFTTAEILINRRQYTSTITLVFKTGPQYFFGQVQFDPGNISHDLLRRYIPFHYGEPYSTEKIISFNNRLSSSGYFKSVLVNPDIDHQRNVPIQVHTQPVPRYSYTLGAGFGTDTGPRGRAALHVIPVNRKGHKFNAIVQGSAKQNALQAQYLIPGQDPFTDQYALTGGFGYLDYNSGISNSLLFSASHLRTLTNYQRILSINGLFERFRYTNEPRTKQFLLYPKATFTFSKTTNPLFSPSGYNITFNGLGAIKGVGSQRSLGQASVDAKAAVTFSPIRTRFFVHGIQGYTAIDDINKLPLSLSLLLGGNDNLKAYSINSIGPGKIISFGSFEIQKETIDKWYLIGFVDAGDVYKPTPRAFKYDVGVGLMWVSPVGPIKIGVAQAVNNRFQRLEGRHPKLVINMGPDLS